MNDRCRLWLSIFPAILLSLSIAGCNIYPPLLKGAGTPDLSAGGVEKSYRVFISTGLRGQDSPHYDCDLSSAGANLMRNYWGKKYVQEKPRLLVAYSPAGVPVITLLDDGGRTDLVDNEPSLSCQFFADKEMKDSVRVASKDCQVGLILTGLNYAKVSTNDQIKKGITALIGKDLPPSADDVNGLPDEKYGLSLSSIAGAAPGAPVYYGYYNLPLKKDSMYRVTVIPADRRFQQTSLYFANMKVSPIGLGLGVGFTGTDGNLNNSPQELGRSLASVRGTAKPYVFGHFYLSQYLPYPTGYNLFNSKNWSRPSHWNRSIALVAGIPISKDLTSFDECALGLRFSLRSNEWRHMDLSRFGLILGTNYKRPPNNESSLANQWRWFTALDYKL